MNKVRVVYDLRSAPDEHPQKVMKRLQGELGFTILGAVPQSIADCWWFWVQIFGPTEWPPYIKEAEWLPIGTA